MNISLTEISESSLSHSESLLQSWLPDGKRNGNEWVARNPTRQDNNPGSFRINMRTGTWADFATDDRGADLIDLYKYINSADTKTAAHAISQQLNIMPTQHQSSPVNPTSPAVKSAFSSLVWPITCEPPPVPAERPVKTDDGWIRHKITHYWKYCDAMGTLLGYVVRYETPSGKETPPLTLWRADNGEVKWRFQGFPKPRPIYNLAKLSHAPAAQVIIVEGEKCAEVLQGLIESAGKSAAMVAVSWPGGSKAIKHVDFSPLQGRKCALWPDNDEAGIKAMADIRDVLSGLGCALGMITNDADTPDGWDVADGVIVDGMGLPAILAYIKQHTQKIEAAQIPASKPVQPPEPEQPIPVDPSSWPFRCLGHAQGYFFYLPSGTQQIREIRGEMHGKGTLLTLAPLAFWEAAFPGSRGADWVYASDTLMRSGERVGPYDPNRVCSRGAMRDKNKIVINLGTKLLVDSVPVKPSEYKSYYIYESGARIDLPDCQPLINSESAKLLEICKTLPLDSQKSAYYLAGWVAISIICGALRWRPHIWVVGPRGSGKSWVLEHIVRRVMGDFCLFVQGSSTEAGIRQRLGRDALAILHDEAEADSGRSQDMIQRELELARQASSEGSGEIAKGSQSGSSVSYRIRSAFMFASIANNLVRAADISRVTVVRFEPRTSKTPEEREREFGDLVDAVKTTLTDDWCDAFRQRIIRLAPIIIANAETFSKAGSEIIGNRRSGDQIGAMLAGAFALTSNNKITEQQAKDWLSKQDFSEEQLLTQDNDVSGCLNHILQAQIRVDGGVRMRSISELIYYANTHRRFCDDDDKTPIPTEECQSTLMRYGIKFKAVSSVEWYVSISDSHRELSSLLKDSPYHKSWRQYLVRIPGSASVHCERFLEATTRATRIEWGQIFNGQF